MAFSVVDTRIQNPAGRGRNEAKKMPRKLSDKQIKYFGSARQKAALKARRSKAANHRPRTATKSPAASRRSNPGPLILSWAAGNPANRSNKVATSKKKPSATAKKRNTAGRPASSKKQPMQRSKRRVSNPGVLGSPMSWVQGGAGVIAGLVGARVVPQIVLGASNTGPVGYVANAGAALALGWVTHMLFPRNPVLVGAVIAGGFGGMLSRVITDKTPFGAQLSLTGLGDYGLGLYQKSNYPYPPRVAGGYGPSTSMFNWGDGGQAPAPATYASAGSDSTAAC